MGSLQTLANQDGGVLWVGTVALICILVLWIWSLQRRNRALEERLDDLFGDASSDNVAALLAEYLGTVRNASAAVDRMRQEHDEIARIMPSVIRHVGLVRFSPFHDTGGAQSFALALLDSRGDGVVVTGLHSRTESRLYAKPVERGNSPYTLIPEERNAMERAFRGELAATS